MAKHSEIEQTVARETSLQNLATKADLQSVQATLVKWIVGTGFAIIIATIAARQLFLWLT